LLACTLGLLLQEVVQVSLVGGACSSGTEGWLSTGLVLLHLLGHEPHEVVGIALALTLVLLGVD